MTDPLPFREAVLADRQEAVAPTFPGFWCTTWLWSGRWTKPQVFYTRAEADELLSWLKRDHPEASVRLYRIGGDE